MQPTDPDAVACAYRSGVENAKLQELGAALNNEHRLEVEIARLKARLEELQQPEGEREERVAAWLRKRGYTITKDEA